ncbi:MAG TPA: trans-aconitate 2-methyltransferase [Roseiarcus sp.]|jgi:trans-aconitate 2-methyltransferase
MARPVANISARPATDWDTALYLKFEAERTQPARDLLARVRGSPRRIVDLGCGPGTSTRLLGERFPDAEILAIDSSEPMLAEARRRLPHVRFEHADIASWSPVEPPDLIFANAALQWLPDHEALFPRLLSHLAENGVLAVQMPDNRQEPSHALMRLIAADGPWADRLVPIAKTRAVIATHLDYYNWLKPLSAALDIWQTTYVHPMPGVGAVVDYFRGSALRPFLNPLDICEREEFIASYMRELAAAYHVEDGGELLFLYPRLFIHARKRAGA